MHEIQAIHVFYTLLAAVAGILGVLLRILRVAKKGFGELKAHKVVMKELLEDLAERKPEAILRIATAMDDSNLRDVIRERAGKRAHAVSAIVAIAAILPFALAARAQTSQTATDYVARRIVFPLLDAPQPVPGASVFVSGNPGPQTVYYWIVTQGSAGASSPAGPFQLSQAPNTLSGSNFDVIAWQPALGALTYDVLRTATAAMPFGACNCAVATGVSTTTTNDQSNSLNAYTVAELAANTLTFTESNESSSVGLSVLRWRVGGASVVTLDSSGKFTPNSIALASPLGSSSGGTGSSTVPGSGQIPIGNGASYVPQTLGQDCTITSAGIITCTKTNNVAFTAPATATPEGTGSKVQMTNAGPTTGGDATSYDGNGNTQDSGKALPAGQIVGTSDTQTFTGKTYDTAGSGNVFKVNGTQITTVSGTGSAVLNTSPTILTPTISGTIPNYNGFVTAGQGLDPNVAAVNLTGQTAAISATTAFAVGTAGMYRICSDLLITTAGTGGNIALVISWNNGATTNTLTYNGLNANTLGNELQNGTSDTCIAPFVAASTNIQYTVQFNSVTGSPQFALRIRVEAL